MRSFVVSALATAAVLSATLAHAGGSVSTAVKNRYLVSKGIAPSDEPVLQTNLFVPVASGLYVNGWWSLGLDDTKFSSNFGDETDLTLGYGGSVGPVLLDISASYYNFHKQGEFGDGDAVQGAAVADLPLALTPVLTLTPYATLEYHVPIGWGPGSQDGAHVIGGLKTRATEGIASVGLRLAGFYDSGTYVGFDSGLLWNCAATLDLAVTESLTLQPVNVLLVAPVTDLDDPRGFEGAYGAGGTWAF
jgi:hypothetical protein